MKAARARAKAPGKKAGKPGSKSPARSEGGTAPGGTSREMLGNPLGDQLRAAIAESGMRPIRIAELSGVSHNAIGYFINGKRDMKLETASAIARVLGLELVKTGPGTGEIKPAG